MNASHSGNENEGRPAAFVLGMDTVQVVIGNEMGARSRHSCLGRSYGPYRRLTNLVVATLFGNQLVTLDSQTQSCPGFRGKNITFRRPRLMRSATGRRL